ncbi:hypothetical protein ACTFIU_002813 [Dictyostelium citrinum]
MAAFQSSVKAIVTEASTALKRSITISNCKSYCSLKELVILLIVILKSQVNYTATYLGTNAIVFVVDSIDRKRLGEVKEEIYNIIVQEELRDVSLLIFANKQDKHKVITTA